MSLFVVFPPLRSSLSLTCSLHW